MRPVTSGQFAVDVIARQRCDDGEISPMYDITVIGIQRKLKRKELSSVRCLKFTLYAIKMLIESLIVSIMNSGQLIR